MYYRAIRKFILTAIPIFGLVHFCAAQYDQERVLYNVALGIKYYAPGISIKINSTEGYVLEFQALHKASGTIMGTLYEFQTRMKGQLSWYAGGGAHLIIWEPSWKKAKRLYGSDGSLAVDGVIGLDYKPEAWPFDISFDWQPNFTFMGANNGNNKFNPLSGGIGLRFAL